MMRQKIVLSTSLIGFALIFILPFNLEAQKIQINSPDGRNALTFDLIKGEAFYSLQRNEKEVLSRSKLGFVLKDQPSLNKNFKLESSEITEFDEPWEQPWGEKRVIRTHYRQLQIFITETAAPFRLLQMTFRIFNDGIGFRYNFPEQEALKDFVIMDEETEFTFSHIDEAWWIPANGESNYEYLFQKSDFSGIDVIETPLTMRLKNGLFITLHEANLTDYTSMTLARTGDNRLKCELVPWHNGDRVRARAPFKTPWRTILIANTAIDLLRSDLILNLNEPNKLEDISWISPAKYIGIWWGMHLDKFTWHMGDKHGATTENAMRYIDFAAREGFDGVLIEGWNEGWQYNWYRDGNGFIFTEPYTDFDMDKISGYAQSQGVQIIGHHETGAAVENYENQMEAAFQYYRDHGIHYVKTGYVGHLLDGGERHHGQYMVRHFRKVIETAARYQIMLIAHEPIKATGIRRTYPNMMSREGARGQEYNAWAGDGGNPPSHTTILPFTRLLSGPMDFTPGIFDLLFTETRPKNRVNTTLAKQLALYVVIYSPVQMAADLPENYNDKEAFQFIRDVPVDWEFSIPLNGEPGEFITFARKDRNSEDWYLGSITNEKSRSIQIKLDFLTPGIQYLAEIYQDSADADWKKNPYGIDIFQKPVDSEMVYDLDLAPGGGQAIRFTPVK